MQEEIVKKCNVFWGMAKKVLLLLFFLWDQVILTAKNETYKEFL